MDQQINLDWYQLKSILDYNPNTGIFKWKISNSNRIKPGDIAGILTQGYCKIGINGKLYLAHHLAWFYVYGYFPENEIDHINRNGTDNRIENLREVSRICNARNTKNRSNNTSGIKGVSFHKQTNKWQVQITVNQKRISLGCHDEFDEAVCYRLVAEQCFNWKGCDSISPAYNYVKNTIQSNF